MIEVRPYEPDDLPVLWAMARLPDAGETADPSVPLPLPARRTPPSGPPELVDPARAVLAAGGTALVATREGHVVGFGGLRAVRDRPRLGRLVRIRVHPAVRRVGAGRALMAALESAARRQGLTDLVLDVGDHQPEALGFYRALGWSESWRESSTEWHWQTVWFHRSLERDHLTVEVRPCADDAEAAAADRAVPSPSGAHRRRWEEQRDGGATYLLAWDGPDVVGHVVLRDRSAHPAVRRELGEHPEVDSLAVAERARRRGVGTALLGAAAGRAQQAGATTLGLAVEPDDQVVTLVRRLGWSLRPGLAPVVDWTWTDHRGVEHEERDRLGYWTLDLPGARGRSAAST
ncbi:GNAT family N-acetyltransferase [Nocardioides litoris]|uniref:GNAT family N-acetyltransferase n=1 Tax=Nocardioides litoris TaxID=1926648 RepID=UPI00112396F6|nr:GNAT family N-acetyltransferase [Nocardioides litoris]